MMFLQFLFNRVNSKWLSKCRFFIVIFSDASMVAIIIGHTQGRLYERAMHPSVLMQLVLRAMRRSKGIFFVGDIIPMRHAA